MHLKNYTRITRNNMKILKERIQKEGKVFPGDILKIDTFLNHKVDTELMDEIGKEFYLRFKDSKPTKILTIEASGIAIACAVSRYFGFVPVVFAKKEQALNMDENKYSTKEKSYTRNLFYDVQVAKEMLDEGDTVLIIDDFLANGEASNSLIEICKQAKAQIAGIGVVVSKAYQPGEKRIRDKGIKLEILANIKSLDDGVIEFCE